MEATLISCSKPSISRPSVNPSRRHGMIVRKVKVVNARKDEFYSGKLVDENMIVLRKRIKEMKVLETGQTPPSSWMGWEKKYVLHYNEDVCEAVGLLQSYLMNTRPSLALGMLALVTLSVPVSTFFIMFNIIEMAKGLLFSGFHPS